MKKKLLGFFALVLGSLTMNAQTTAMQFAGQDCNGNNVDLFADLNAGKCVVLFYYMPNCGACPPPASSIQTMANNVMNTYPGLVKGYAYPYQNSTTCTYSASWVTNNNLNFYAPMDSGATQVAYYGGFGMPTVVLVGGLDHRVMFVTQSFLTSDTTIMRDSILNFLSAVSVNNLPTAISSVNTYPNPANTSVTAEINLTKSSTVTMQIVNILGEVVETVYNGETPAGTLRKEISTATYAEGNYFLRITSDGEVTNQNFTVIH